MRADHAPVPEPKVPTRSDSVAPTAVDAGGASRPCRRLPRGSPAFGRRRGPLWPSRRTRAPGIASSWRACRSVSRPSARGARDQGHPPDDRRDHLRHERLIGDWIALAPREAQKLAWRDLLLRRWPRLLPGSAASATHAVIRARSALASGSGSPPGSAAAGRAGPGLGHRAARYQQLPGHPDLAGRSTRRLPRRGCLRSSRGCRRKVRESAVGSAHWPASSAYPAAWTGGVRQPARILLWMTSVRPPLGCRPPATACVFDQDPTRAGG